MELLNDYPVTLPVAPHFRSLEAQANHLLKARKVRRRGKRKRIPRMTYREYMGSAYWKRRKARYFQEHGKGCAVCGQKKGTTLHHKRYNREEFGREPDDALIALCRHHHHEYHEQFGVQSDMTETSDLYAHHARQVEEFVRSADWIARINKQPG